MPSGTVFNVVVLVSALLTIFARLASSFVHSSNGRAQLSYWAYSRNPRESDNNSSRRRCRLTGGRQRLTCGLQITVRIRGKKSREEDYTNQQAYDEYVKRLRPVLALDTHWHKTDEDLEAAVRKDSGVVVCLDEGGRQMNSPAFSDFLFSKLEEGGSRLTFVVGGAEGLPPGLKHKPPQGGAKL
ncbi:unnamed protein product, partial [Hapterophycus canaliculatus]